MDTQTAASVEQPGTRSDLREQAILDAALDLVAEVGYERMTMDVLAARARASKATIYRRWPGKAQLIAEAVRRRGCPAMAQASDTGTLRGDLLAALCQQRDKLTGEDGPLLTGLIMAARHDDELASLLRAYMDSDKQRVAVTLLDRAAARHEVRAPLNPALIGEIVPALLLMRLLVTGQPIDDPYLAHVVDDVLLPLLAGCPTCSAPSTG